MLAPYAEGVAQHSPGLPHLFAATLGGRTTPFSTPKGLRSAGHVCLTGRMAQSLANILVHLVFSTKGRHPFLATEQQRAAVHRYLAAVSARLGCPAISVGGTADHVHCLARQGRTITVAEWVKELKRTSSQHAKTQAASLHDFQWQAGYGAFW
jgi:REP element-mobilizing transposase RayT